ncbi:MAG: NAD(P)/FAD-dependent oxidoreductase [bacterium]
MSFDDSLPQKTDVVVIGGGVIGVSTAWYLAKAGVRVILCEKGRVAGEQSSRNWGWVRQQGRDEAELPIMMESNQIWQGLSEEIGVDIGFRQHGVMYVAETEKEMSEFQTWAGLAKRHGLESALLTPGQIRDQVQGFQGAWKGGVVTPSDGRAEPFVAVPAMAAACRNKGVLIKENCAVRNLLTRGGEAAGVITEHGEIQCQAVVCAAGAWSSTFTGHAGLSFPQLSVKSTVVRTASVEDIYSGNAACEDFALRRRQDGGYTLAPSGLHEHFINRDSIRFFKSFLPNLIESWSETRLRLGQDAPGGWDATRTWRDDQSSPFERNRVLNPRPARSTLDVLRKRLRRRLPAIGEIEFVESWAGMIDTTPDVVPVMDEISSIPGFYLASGFSGHGFGIGPAAGRVMADMIQGNPCGHDLTRFRFSRFSDGSKFNRGPAL